MLATGHRFLRSLTDAEHARFQHEVLLTEMIFPLWVVVIILQCQL